jgi:hypothetical protein
MDHLIWTSKRESINEMINKRYINLNNASPEKIYPSKPNFIIKRSYISDRKFMSFDVLILEESKSHKKISLPKSKPK